MCEETATHFLYAQFKKKENGQTNYKKIRKMAQHLK